ncbi:hypothetical protein EDB84DRAFT_1587159 [Lactarius hengduanensis]|nr:hypothetical protein EDB84DRAFT_1587159 [Lactarius hengduanensis]
MNKKVEQAYQRNLAQKAVLGHPREDILYAILIDFLALHQVPLHRFTIYPQMNLKWNPTDHNDHQFEILDFSLVNFTSPNTNPFFKLRCGVEAQTQVKAAYKNSYPLTNDRVQWILVVGPYWLPKIFGPFSKAELGEMNKPPPKLEELYLLGTLELYNCLEGIIASTDELAKPCAKPFIDGILM